MSDNTCACCEHATGLIRLWSDKNLVVCYAFAHLGQLNLHLAQDDAEHHQTGALYIHVDDADQLAENWRRAGLDVIGPENQGYGKREGRRVDPDGNLIRFGSPVPD